MDFWQDSMYRIGNYRVMDVDQNCVRMSEFIETKLKCQYENGRAFYEVMENDSEEDLLYCKKVLRPQTNKVFSYSYIQCRYIIMASKH